MKIDLRKSGSDAIAAVKNTHYDLVFMDHKMPGKDGIETTLEIRAMKDEDPYYKTVPIIALTANAVSGTEEMFLQNGFNDFLSKPIDTVMLNAILEKWIPKEKQKGATIESNRMKESKMQEAVNSIEIESLDTKKGITISGGKPEFYLN
jgi:CheY-like chemotaxis protein